MKLVDFLSKYAGPSSPISAEQPKITDPIDDLPPDPATWPEDWRYAFMERSGMLMNTGITQEEADSVAESIVREEYAKANDRGNAQEVLK